MTDKVVQDPEGMAAAALRALGEIVGCSTREISAIGLVGTWHSLLLLDAEDRPLGPISMWSDLSAAPTVDELRKGQAFVRSCYQKTGCMVHAMYPAFKYRHLKQTQHELVRRVLSFLTGGVSLWVLRGKGVSLCTASGTAFQHLRWTGIQIMLDFAACAPSNCS